MTSCKRAIAALGAALVAISALAQQPAPQPAPNPNYPVDGQGRANPNATCLPCRGFAQELRMYQDAVAALKGEFERRTAAVRALTDAALKGTVTPEQFAQATVDAKVAEALEKQIAVLEPAVTRAAETLTACMKQYCSAPAGGPSGPDPLIEPPPGGAPGGSRPGAGPPSGPAEAPPRGPGGGSGAAPGAPSQPPSVPGAPVTPAPGTPVEGALGPCGCDKYALEALRLKRRAEELKLEADAARAEELRLHHEVNKMVNELVTIAKGDYGSKLARLLDFPPLQELVRQRDALYDQPRLKSDQAYVFEVMAATARAEHEECMKRCQPPPPPQVLISTGTGGNNPFDPNNPMGGRPATTPAGGIGALQFSSPTFGGAEGGAVLITVDRVGGRRGIVSVSYSTSGGNATPGSDYVAVSGTLTWADGDDGAKSFSIALPDDTQVEATETFNVSLSRFTGGAAQGSPVVASVSIADNDSTAPAPAGALQFASSSFSTAEGNGSVTISVARVNGSSGAVGVQYFTGPASATAGSDYQAVNGALQWANGDVSTKSFTVPIMDDTAVEGPETFFVTLNGPTGGATLGAPATATVTIQDNDMSTPVGPCGAQGNAWQPNTGPPYSCFGSCSPNANSPVITVNGDQVSVSNFHQGGSASFAGCGPSLTSTSNTLVYFGQANHTATITRSSNNAFNANITSSGGGSCSFSCAR